MLDRQPYEAMEDSQEQSTYKKILTSIQAKATSAQVNLKDKENWKIFLRSFRDHFLTASYVLSNTSLYFYSSLEVLLKVELLDEKIDEDNLLFYFFIACALDLGVITYSAYLKTTNEYFTHEFAHCANECNRKRVVKTVAGTVGSSFKAFASCGSLYLLSTKVFGRNVLADTVVAIASAGNLFANLSILNRPEKADLLPQRTKKDEPQEMEEVESDQHHLLAPRRV